MATRIMKPLLIGAAATAFISCISGYVWLEQHREPLLEIYVFALKSGRSMFIRTPDDQRILVDGGGNSQVVLQLTDIIPFYSRRIDTIIITNTEGKNVSGLIDVLERYNVGKVYVPRYTAERLNLSISTDKIYETLLDTLIQKGITPLETEARDQIPIGQDTYLGVLFPVSADLFEFSKASPPELLFTISYKNNSVLFMGDASKKVQKFVASSSVARISTADALIVSHGGAPTNMSADLIRAVQPTYLVYEKNMAKSVPTSGSKKKISDDPLATIFYNNRFNLKETGSVKIISDGEVIDIQKAP